MYLEGIIIFCLAIVLEPVLCYGKDAMADDPILNHLQMDPNTVMGYELLGNDVLHQLNKRDLHGGTPLKVYTMNESIDLLLHPPRNSILATAKTLLYVAKKDRRKSGGVDYHSDSDIMPLVGRLLEDPKHLASLVINKNHHNQPTVNGVVRSKRHDANLVIRSLPNSVVQEHLRKRRSTTGSADQHLSQSEHLTNHVIVKVKDDEASKKPREGRELLSTTQIKTSSVHYNTKRDIKTGFNGTLYLKLLIHLDSTYLSETYPGDGDLIRLLEKRVELVSLMEYVLAFWNSVELPYRNLENPTIQFHIAGIVIASSPQATPYFANVARNDGSIDIYSAIEPAKSFYYQVKDQMPFSTYDLVVAMTKRKNAGSAAGTAETGSLCTDPTQRQKQGAVVMMHDDHGFGGIHTAIHEVGHAFGLNHDGDTNSSCSGNDYFIMSAVDSGSDKSTIFSPCSVDELRKALRAKKFECLYKRPTLQGSSLPLLAAGKISNMDQQCQARNFTRACGFAKNEFCESLGCDAGFEDGRRTCEFFVGAAPGTPCDTGNGGKLGICFMNRCVPGN